MTLGGFIAGLLPGAVIGGAMVLLWLRGKLALAQAELAHARSAAAEKLQVLENARAELTLRFQQLSQEILEDKSARFTAQNQQNLDALLKPLNENIHRFQQQVRQTYELETRDRVALKEQIAQLQQQSLRVSAEANNLATALRGESKTQGAWGEMILERILELSGLEKGREYETQFHARAEDGARRRPDAIVRLPGGRDIVVDAKVSLTAYARLAEGADDAARLLAREAHVGSVRAHLRELSAKDYHALENISTLDFVLMFVPSEAAYIEAIRFAPELYAEALAKNIVMVCPSTLLPALRTVAYGWKTERQNLNAQQIALEAGKLYDKFVGFEQDLAKIGSALAAAQTAYGEARGKLVEGPGNLVRKTEALRKMGAKANKQLPENLRQLAADDVEDAEKPLAPPP